MHRNPTHDRCRTALPVVVLLAALVSFAGRADSWTGTAPRGFSSPLESSVTEVRMPPVDEAALIAEDEARLAAGWDGPARFAAPLTVSIDLLDAGTLDRLDDGGRLWRLRVISEGARTLNFGIAGFDLPSGATLHLYPADRSSYDGPYTSADNILENEFWSPVIPSDDVVIELYLPAGAAFEYRPTLIQVNHDYVGFGNPARGNLRQGWCNNDVVCPEGDPWRDEIRSEGVYTLNGVWTCSGQLLNSVTDTPPPYFLTARHCGISSTNDHTVRVYWNFESPECGDLCCGSLTDNQQGSTLLARYNSSDFCLVELTAEPDSEFNVYYAGWDAREENMPQECTAIHHPNTDEKAISFNTDPLTVTSYLGTNVPGDGTHWRVDDWEDGTTEVGSSGSAIWDENHHVVGQLHGGYASCSSITSDWYGRFSRSWTGGGNPSSRLMDWLDPDTTGTLVLDGRDPNTSLAVGEGRISHDTTGLVAANPNPAKGSVEIRFLLPEAGAVAITIHDVSGRAVAALPAQTYAAGTSHVVWDGKDAAGNALPSGVYFVRMTAGGQSVGSVKLVVLR